MDPVSALLLAAAKAGATAIVSQVGKNLLVSRSEKATQRAALADCLAHSLRAVASAFPSAQAEGFDPFFVSREPVAALLSKYLTLTQQPSAEELAVVWLPLINSETSPPIRVRFWSEVFLERFESSLRNHPAVQDQQYKRLRSLSGGVAEEHNALQDYLSWLERRTRRLDTRGVSDEPAEVELDSCFEGMRVIEDRSFAWSDRPVSAAEIEQLRNDFVAQGLSAVEIEERLEDDRLDLYLTRHASAPGIADALGLIAAQRQIVILGDPGAGKSTLLRYAAHRHAIGCLRGWESLSNGLGPTRFPIMVRVAEFVELADWRMMPFIDFVKQAPGYGGCPRATEVGALLERQLRAGSCLVLVDGLDEIPRATDRERVVTKVREFIEDFSQTPELTSFVVTSRVAGYRSAPLTSRYLHCRLLDLDDEQIDHFTRRWARSLEEALGSDLPQEDKISRAERVVTELSRATREKPTVRQLAGTPLLLTMMILRLRSGGTLPSRRARLYGDIASAMAGSWRSLQVPAGTILPDERDVLSLLAKIGVWIHRHSPTGLISEDKLVELLREGNFNSDLIVALREHVGIIAQRAPERYGFAHRTFQEFFAGLDLLDRPDCERDTLVSSLIDDPIWQEPILLGLGWLGDRTPSRVRSAMKAVVWPFAESEADLSVLEALTGERLVFLLRCLADDLPCTPDLVDYAARKALESEFGGGPPYLDWFFDLPGVIRGIGRSAHGPAFSAVFRAAAKCARADDGQPIAALAALGVLAEEEISQLRAWLDEAKTKGLKRLYASALGRSVDYSEAACVEVRDVLRSNQHSYDLKDDMLWAAASLRPIVDIADVLTETALDAGNYEWLRMRAMMMLASAYPSHSCTAHVIERCLLVEQGVALATEAATAAGAVARRRPADAIRWVHAAADNRQRPFTMRVSAAVALGDLRRLGIPGALAACQSLIGRSPGDLVAVAALDETCLELGVDISECAGILSDPMASEEYRSLLLGTLSRARLSWEVVGPQALSLLRNRAGEDGVRSAAARAIGTFGEAPDSVIEELVAIGMDASESESVRSSCATALGQLGVSRREMVAPLLDLLRDPAVTYSFKEDLLRLADAASVTRIEAVDLALSVLRDCYADTYIRERAVDVVQHSLSAVTMEQIASVSETFLAEAASANGLGARRALLQLAACERSKRSSELWGDAL